MGINNVLKATNWPLLRQQKRYLRELMDVVKDDEGYLDGLLNFIDVIQDATVDSGTLTEEEVFGDLS